MNCVLIDLVGSIVYKKSYVHHVANPFLPFLFRHVPMWTLEPSLRVVALMSLSGYYSDDIVSLYFFDLERSFAHFFQLMFEGQNSSGFLQDDSGWNDWSAGLSSHHSFPGYSGHGLQERLLYLSIL